MVNDVSESYVEEKAEIVATSVASQFSNHKDMLISCSSLFESINLNNSSVIFRKVQTIRRIGSFKAVGVVGSNGVGMDNEGHFLEDASDQTFYKEAIKGKPYISDLVKGTDGETDVIIISIPLMRDDVPAGVLFGVLDQSFLSGIISSNHGLLTGVSFLITKDGRIMASSDPKITSSEPGNDGYFATDIRWTGGKGSVPYIRERIFDKDATTTYRYTLDGEEKHTIITPVADYPWVLTIVLPESALMERTKMMGLYMSLLILAVIVSVSLLVFALVRVAKSDSDMVRHKERYEIATRQNRSIVFDYDSGRRRLELSGSYDVILGKRSPVLEGAEVDAVLGLIHEDDEAFRNLLDNVDKLLDSQINAEARFKCEDGNYRWFKLRANILRGHDGKVKEIVGSMMNADNRVRNDYGLKYREDLDIVTGLLNKNSFEKQVEEKLRNADSGNMFALYLIDIDNFSGLNEQLGHNIGDKIICDTANKIGRVFTDKDCIARYAGDEFAVLLLLSPETKRIGQRIVEDKAYRLCKAIDETYSNGKSDFRITVSVGVSCFPDDGNTYDDLYRRADAALYAAKHSGKNQCCIYRNGG